MRQEQTSNISPNHDELFSVRPYCLFSERCADPLFIGPRPGMVARVKIWMSQRRLYGLLSRKNSRFYQGRGRVQKKNASSKAKPRSA